MNSTVAVRKCKEYNFGLVYSHIEEIYNVCGGPDLRNKKVLLKPNVLSNNIPERCVTTHPVVLDAMIAFARDHGATVFAGDSPAIHSRGFRPVKTGIIEVCEKRGVPWIDFMDRPSEIRLKSGRIKVASIAREADLIISLPKFKTHELMYLTGAVKNTLGLVPGFIKAKQHALYQSRESFSSFLVDLTENITPDFYLMDAIQGMEGPGPGQGTPVRTEILIGSSNPLAVDIIASKIAGYDPMDIPTNRIALNRGNWLRTPEALIYNGPVLDSLVKKDFRRIRITSDRNISLQFIKNRIKLPRKFERRPVFIHENCTGCRECIKICPQNAIVMDETRKNHVVLTDSKCIRCFCCSEVCNYNAVKIKVKVFGV